MCDPAFFIAFSPKIAYNILISVHQLIIRSVYMSMKLALNIMLLVITVIVIGAIWLIIGGTTAVLVAGGIWYGFMVGYTYPSPSHL